MGAPVVTVAAGGMAVVDVTATTGVGLPVSEAANGRGIAVTKVVGKPGLAVVYGAGGAPAALPPPVLVNNTTQAFTTAAALTLPLPGSRVNGNLLVAFIRVNSPAAGTLTWPAGWTPIDTSGNTGGPTASWAYRYVDGAETAPNVTWTNTATCSGAVMQFSGVKASVPIGAVAKNFQSSGTVVSCPAIVPVGLNSLALYIVHMATAVVAAAGWTNMFDLNSSGRQQGYRKDLGAIGVSAGAIAVTIGAFTNVSIISCEILSQ